MLNIAGFDMRWFFFQIKSIQQMSTSKSSSANFERFVEMSIIFRYTNFMLTETLLNAGYENGIDWSQSTHTKPQQESEEKILVVDNVLGAQYPWDGSRDFFYFSLAE